MFFYVVPVLIFGGMLLGSFLYKTTLAKQTTENTLKEKLAIYQKALITRCASSEGASLFGIVCYTLEGNLLYLILVGVNLLYFLWIRPTKQKIEDELNLGYEDKAELGW